MVSFLISIFNSCLAGTWKEVSNCRFKSEFRALVAEATACHDSTESFLARRMLQGWSIVRRRLEDQRR